MKLNKVSCFIIIIFCCLLTACGNGTKVEVLAEHPDVSSLKISNSDPIEETHIDLAAFFDNDEAYKYMSNYFPNESLLYEQGKLAMLCAIYDFTPNEVGSYRILTFSRVAFKDLKEGSKISVLMLPYENNGRHGFNSERYEGQIEIAKKSDDKVTVRFNKAEFSQVDNLDNVWILDGLVTYPRK